MFLSRGAIAKGIGGFIALALSIALGVVTYHNFTNKSHATNPPSPTPPIGFSQGPCPPGYYDQTKGCRYQGCIENSSFPPVNESLPDGSQSICLPDSTSPPVIPDPPLGYVQNYCFPGYYDSTKDGVYIGYGVAGSGTACPSLCYDLVREAPNPGAVACTVFEDCSCLPTSQAPPSPPPNSPPPGYSQGLCPIQYYDCTQGHTKGFSQCPSSFNVDNCPGELADVSCTVCACVRNDLSPPSLPRTPLSPPPSHEAEVPPHYSQNFCPSGYYDATNGNMQTSLTTPSNLCPGGFPLVDENNECACVPNSQPPTTADPPPTRMIPQPEYNFCATWGHLLGFTSPEGYEENPLVQSSTPPCPGGYVLQEGGGCACLPCLDADATMYCQGS